MIWTSLLAEWIYSVSGQDFPFEIGEGQVMSAESDGMFLSPLAEAERLWDGVRQVSKQAGSDIAQLSEMIDLGMRVVEILTIECLRRVRLEFPPTICLNSVEWPMAGT